MCNSHPGPVRPAARATSDKRTPGPRFTRLPQGGRLHNPDYVKCAPSVGIRAFSLRISRTRRRQERSSLGRGPPLPAVAHSALSACIVETASVLGPPRPAEKSLPLQGRRPTRSGHLSAPGLSSDRSIPRINVSPYPKGGKCGLRHPAALAAAAAGSGSPAGSSSLAGSVRRDLRASLLGKPWACLVSGRYSVRPLCGFCCALPMPLSYTSASLPCTAAPVVCLPPPQKAFRAAGGCQPDGIGFGCFGTSCALRFLRRPCVPPLRCGTGGRVRFASTKSFCSG